MNLRTILLVAACSAASLSTVSAQDGSVQVSFANGRVTVVAVNATVSDILREWTRVGGSSFVNAERISRAARLTLRLENESEIHAIEVLLRSVSGYAVAPRLAGTTAMSSIGTVVIMPTPRPREYPAPASRPGQAFNESLSGPRRPVPVRPDDDGPVRVEAPPVWTAEQGPVPIGGSRQGGPAQTPATRTIPGFGVTSSTPGVIIGGGPAQPPVPGRVPPPPPKPKPGGGGG
ncbi:MAG: hypothetical protein WD690_09615 [Vicinamibacterales bacterium]